MTQITALDSKGDAGTPTDPRTGEAVVDAGPVAVGGGAGAPGAGMGGVGGTGAAAPAPEFCSRGGLCREVENNVIDTMDLLFVVDNSQTMEPIQQQLRAEFPRLIEALTTGHRDAADPLPFPPIRSLHMGVVSTDLGTAGATDVPACEGFGDDGVLRELAASGCNAGEPGLRFLSYIEGTGDPMLLATDLQCLASVGTNGCGYEQPLEAAMKALWPAGDAMLSFQGEAHGAAENQGFLRSDPETGVSLLMVVVVTDEDDCSVADPAFFNEAGEGNLRCALHADKLHDVNERYAQAMLRLRPGYESRIVYGVIAGVPKDLVDATARAGVDFSDAAQRDAYYDGILSDARMQAIAEGDAGHLASSCDTAAGTATPPVRLVELAKAMGEQAVVSSLCDTDLTDAITPLIEKVAAREHPGCMDGLPARDHGLRPCDVIWELPTPREAPAATPVLCSQASFLMESERYPSDADGRARCVVTQLSFGGEADNAPLDEGWYFDEASDDLLRTCPAGYGRIGFTPQAKPPAGVRVYLDCGSQLNQE